MAKARHELHPEKPGASARGLCIGKPHGWGGNEVPAVPERRGGDGGEPVGLHSFSPLFHGLAAICPAKRAKRCH